jgi:hypothetical protein
MEEFFHFSNSMFQIFVFITSLLGELFRKGGQAYLSIEQNQKKHPYWSAFILLAILELKYVLKIECAFNTCVFVRI